MAVVILGVKCRHCGRAISLSEAPKRGTPERGFTCEKCELDNAVAIKAFSEQLTDGYAQDLEQRCAECRIGLDEIERLTGARIMYLHHKDGVRQLLCSKCSDWYSARAKDLFKDTAYQHIKKLKGYK